MSGHSLLLEFDCQDESFARGFELGRVWAVLRETDDNFECEMHVASAEMILRLAESTGRTVRIEEHDGTWATAFFSEVAE